MALIKKKKNEVEVVQERLVETLEDVELRNYGDLLTKDDFIYTLNNDEQTCTIHKLLKTTPILIIPNEIEGHKVTVLENKESEAIFEGDTVVTVVIPDSVRILGKHCFNECRSVKTFKIGNNVEVLDVGSFSYCEGIKDIIIPESVQIISDYAFRNCTNLERITILGANTKISNDPYVFINSKGIFNGTIYSSLDSEAKKYTEIHNRNFEEYKYVKLEAIFKGIRPTEKNRHIISPDDFDVFATWSNTVVDKIKDYQYTVETKMDGTHIIIMFMTFQYEIFLPLGEKKLTSIDVKYVGNQPRKIKYPLENKEFDVIAHYDDLSKQMVDDFMIENDKLSKGINEITIIHNGIIGMCEIIGKKGFLWF